ncbi:GNAT family N-acetyltransferase [Microbacterium sp. NPDC055357]
MTDQPDLTHEPTVTRDDAQSRYEVHVGDVLAGFTEFRTDSRGRVVFPHTEVDPAFRGKGLAGVLIGEAMTDSAARGDTVVPVCPAVAKYVRANEIGGLTVAWPDGP